jgi:heme-degrading monooxygenase HmoA
MFTTVSIHQMIPGKEDSAIEMFSTNTRIARKLEGFIGRDILIAVDDPLKLTTVTSWKTMGQVQAFKTNPDRPRGGGPYVSSEDITVYEDVPVV